jgi:hypothetical protein
MMWDDGWNGCTDRDSCTPWQSLEKNTSGAVVEMDVVAMLLLDMWLPEYTFDCHAHDLLSTRSNLLASALIRVKKTARLVHSDTSTSGVVLPLVRL